MEMSVSLACVRFRGFEGGKFFFFGGGERLASGRTRERKARLGSGRRNRNLWSPFRPCRPAIPTAIRGKRERARAAGTSDQSRPPGDVLRRGTEEETARGYEGRFVPRIPVTPDQRGFTGFTAK